MPEVLPPEADGVTSAPIRVPAILDEREFMQECADRFNAFIEKCPREARHLFAAFLPYQHELAEFQDDEDPEDPPGITVGALLAGILQTPHRNGWYLRPLLARDPEIGTIIIRLDVARQDILKNKQD